MKLILVLVMTTISLPSETLLVLNTVKAQEAQRLKRPVTHAEFIAFLSKLYTRVSGDTRVLDGVWEKIEKG